MRKDYDEPIRWDRWGFRNPAACFETLPSSRGGVSKHATETTGIRTPENTAKASYKLRKFRPKCPEYRASRRGLFVRTLSALRPSRSNLSGLSIWPRSPHQKRGYQRRAIVKWKNRGRTQTNCRESELCEGTHEL